MQLHPWIIASWPIIERPCESAPEFALDLHHLGTTATGDCDDFGRLLGHTIWGSTNAEVGIAWDWVEALDGVFAMSDPMGVVSNIGFVDKTGAGIPEFMAAVQLNRITHALPWQTEVAKATRGLRAADPWSDRVRSSRSRTRRAEDYPRRSRAVSDSELQRL